MSYLVVVLLSVLWLVYFVPSLVQARRTSSPLASAETFRHSLATLAARAGQPRPARRTATRTRRRAAAIRRRRVLGGLASTVAIAVLVGALAGGMLWMVVPPLLALAGYVALLRRSAVQRGERPVPAVTAERQSVTVEPPAVIPSVGRRADQLERLERIAG